MSLDYSAQVTEVMEATKTLTDEVPVEGPGITLALEDGVYQDLSHGDYHAMVERLSHSGAVRLVPPSCPAKFRWWQDQQTAGDGEHTSALDVGQAVHTLVFGAGPQIEIVDTGHGRTAKATKEAMRKVWAAGGTPLTPGEQAQATMLAAAVHADQTVRSLLAQGEPETSFLWHDQIGQVPCRGRADWITHTRDGRTVIVDLKTALDASPAGFGRASANLGYAQQADFYGRGLRALGLAGGDVAFVLIAVEKTEPYLVGVYELDHDALVAGRVLNDMAIATWAQCVREDRWPGYTQGIEPLALPYWYTRPLIETGA